MFKGKVVSIEGEKVRLELEDGQQLVLPSSAVEGALKEGMDVALVVAALGSEDAGRQVLARHLLNGILGE